MKENKLIAEFMGMELGDDKTMYYDDAENLHPPTPINELKFHSSWDWLMPVVDKIENDHKANVKIMSKWNEFDSCNYYQVIIVIESATRSNKFYLSGDCIAYRYMTGFQDCKKKAIYKAVVEFINFYNDANKRNKKSKTYS